MNICVKYHHIYKHRYATHQLHTNEQRCNIRGVVNQSIQVFSLGPPVWPPLKYSNVLAIAQFPRRVPGEKSFHKLDL